MSTATTATAAQSAQEGKHREEFVLQLFRLFKLVTMHQLNNQAVQRSIEAATSSFSQMLMQEQTKLAALFAGDNIFVNGQPLKASRGTYESASELGKLLHSVGVNEITIWQEATPQDFEEVLGQFVRSRQQRTAQGQSMSVPGRVRLQYVDPTYLLGVDEGELTAEEQMLRTYTAAVVVMRRVLEGVEAGRYELMRVVKRIGQRLVVLAQEDDHALVQATALRTSSHDRAEQALVAAITAVVSARLLTNDLRELIDIATATLCFDVGLERLHGLKRFEDDPFALDGIKVELTLEEQAHGPSSTSVALIGLAGLYETSTRRLVLTYEARASYQGLEVYQGKAMPSVEAVLIAQAHKLQALLATDEQSEGLEPRSLDELLELWVQGQKTRGEQAVGRQICTALGIYPRGTIVQLSSGWLGVVLGTPRAPSCYSRPMVRLMVSPSGEELKARDVHLSVINAEVLKLGTITHVIHVAEQESLNKMSEQVKQGQWSVPSAILEAPLRAAAPQGADQGQEKKRAAAKASGVFKKIGGEPKSASSPPQEVKEAGLEEFSSPDPNTDVLSLTDNHARKLRMERLRFLASLDDDHQDPLDDGAQGDEDNEFF